MAGGRGEGGGRGRGQVYGCSGSVGHIFSWLVGVHVEWNRSFTVAEDAKMELLLGGNNEEEATARRRLSEKTITAPATTFSCYSPNT